MKTLLSFVASVLLSSSAMAMGGVWVLEIEYKLAGESQKGYIIDENWREGFEDLIGKDSLFLIEFRKKFGAYDSLEVFAEIIDQEQISKIASFPMHPFFLVEDSKSYVQLDDIEGIALKKVWKKIAYTIKVLTKISLSDSNWLKQSSTKEFPLGEYAGCRLEAHIFGKREIYDQFVPSFTELYLRKDSLTRDELTDYRDLLKLLKKSKTVIIELCGC